MRRWPLPSDTSRSARGLCAQHRRRTLGAPDRARPAPGAAPLLRSAERSRRYRDGHPRHPPAHPPGAWRRATGRSGASTAIRADRGRPGAAPGATELARWGAPRLRLPADTTQIPPRVPLTSLLIGATALPRAANGRYEVSLEDETVRVDVSDGQVHAAPDSEPDTTIALSLAGLGALILGANASELEQTAGVSIQGDSRRAHAFLDALTGAPLLAGLRPQLQGMA